jgi:DNA-binding NtrC family response regulator
MEIAHPSDDPTKGGTKMDQIQRHKSGKNLTGQHMIVNMIRRSNVQKLKARILVVDDDSQTAETLKDLLMFAGFEVETAGNGKQAIELLTTARHFDLLITDMQMPQMDGLQLLKLSHQVREHLPVIVLTGHGTVDNGIHSLEEGACDYILKPFNSEKLLRVVQGALRNRSWAVCTA